MDAKITLSFDEDIINKAKTFADDHNISLSRLTEFLYSRITKGQYRSLEELPVSEWVSMVAEGAVEYKATPKPRKYYKSEFLKSRKTKAK